MSSRAFVPGALGGGDIAGAILRLPGESLAHGVPGDLIAESLRARRAPPVCQAPLMNCTTPTRWPRPSMRKASPKAAVDLPLPVPVWTMSRPFSIVLPATSASCTALRLRHLRAMPLGFGLVDRVRVMAFLSVPFTASGNPATTSTTRSARAAMRWLSTPCRSRKCRPSGFSGTMPEPTSLATSTTGGGAAASAAQAPRSRLDIGSASIRFDSHSVRQSTSTGVGRTISSAAARSRGASMVCHCGAAPRAMRGDARGHFRVTCFGRRHVKSKAAAGRRSGFRHSGFCPNGRRRGRE